MVLYRREADGSVISSLPRRLVAGNTVDVISEDAAD